MACDLCGAKGGYLVDLLDCYKTDEVKQVCTACETHLNKYVWRIRAVLDGTLRTLFKRYLTERQRSAIAGKTIPATIKDQQHG